MHPPLGRFQLRYAGVEKKSVVSVLGLCINTLSLFLTAQAKRLDLFADSLHSRRLSFDRWDYKSCSPLPNLS